MTDPESAFATYFVSFATFCSNRENNRTEGNEGNEELDQSRRGERIGHSLTLHNTGGPGGFAGRLRLRSIAQIANAGAWPRVPGLAKSRSVAFNLVGSYAKPSGNRFQRSPMRPVHVSPL